MLRLAAIVGCAFAPLHAQAVEPLPGPVPAEVVRVIDGDTVQVRARIWPGQFVETRVRLRGVDTPETRRPDCEAERAAGHAATAFTAAWLSWTPEDPGLGAGEAVGDEEARTPAAPAFVGLYDVDLGSFAGRVVARIERGDGADLSADLIAEGLAVAYGADGPWCAEPGEASR